MFCRNCGTQNEEGAQFCHSCGTQLHTSAQPQSPQQTYNASQFVQPPNFVQNPPKKKKGCLIALIAVAALVLVLIIVAVWSGGEISFTTANISQAYMASSVDPYTSEPIVKTDVFPQSTTTEIYATALVKNIPGDTQVTAIWYHLPTGSSLSSDLIVPEDMWVSFSFTNPDGFPLGEYKVELIIDDEVDETLYFTVE